MKKSFSMVCVAIFALIIASCGNKHVKIKSIGIPYQLKISELLKKIGKNEDALPEPSLDPESKKYTNFLGRDITSIRLRNNLNDTLNTRIIVLPLEIQGVSIVERSGIEIRECSFKGDIDKYPEKGYMLSIVDTIPENDRAGALLIDPEHLRKLHWIDNENKIQKDICLDSPGEDLNKNIQIRKINAQALKKALDEIDAQEK